MTRSLLVLLGTWAIVLPATASAEQAGQPSAAAAGRLDAGWNDTCAVLAGGDVRCWGYGGDGELGYGDTRTIGDDEAPGSAGPVNLGAGRTAIAISAGDFHTCAVLDDGNVRCWGFGSNGRLGYGNTQTIGDDEAPGSVAPVNLGSRRTATAITAGGGHSCALLDDGSVRCWGFNGSNDTRGGQLGYGNTKNVGDDEVPGAAGPVKLGGRARAITAGQAHTCALLDDGNVRCWGDGADGRLGYGNEDRIGDDETPDSRAPVDLGFGRKATAISAGDFHTCAVLDDGTVRCWGLGADGRLGYANTQSIGDGESPGSVLPVNLGLGAKATAISAGGSHTCALLDDGSVRCWGAGASGRLGYGNQTAIGDDEAPGSVAPVDLGPGRFATAITTGRYHSCARLDDATVRCWGYGLSGRLGYCSQANIGADETPGSAGPVDLGSGGAACPTTPGGASPSTGTPTVGATAAPAARAPLPDVGAAALASQARRARAMRSCLANVERHAGRERRRARPRDTNLHRRSGRRRCLRIYGRTPGGITGLRPRTRGRTQIELAFNAAGTDASHPPPARSYLVKQSRRPIRSARDFARAHTLCKGACRFKPTRVGGNVSLTVTDLRPHTTYYYAIAARDNVSARRGRRSRAVKARTR